MKVGFKFQREYRLVLQRNVKKRARHFKVLSFKTESICSEGTSSCLFSISSFGRWLAGSWCQVFAQRITTHLVLSPPPTLLVPSSCCRQPKPSQAVRSQYSGKTNEAGGSIRGAPAKKSHLRAGPPHCLPGRGRPRAA